MASLSDNIKHYRILNKLTQKQLANLLNIAPTAISAWEVGRNKPLMDNIEAMSKIFKIKKSELLGDDLQEIPYTSTSQHNNIVQAITDTVVKLDPPRQETVLSVAREELDAQTNLSDKITNIEDYRTTDDVEEETMIVHGLESAGGGIWHEGDTDIEVRIPTSEIPNDFDDLAMVIGDSMRPRLHNGDILFVKFTKQIEIGQIGVFRTSKGNFVKKLQADRLESLNREYDDVYFSDGEYAEAVGVVVDFYRK